MNNFVQQFLSECQDLPNEIITTGQNLYAAIRDDIAARRRLQEAEKELAAFEADLITEATMRAGLDKTGALAGIATTSSAFKFACESLVAKSRKEGAHAQLYAHVVHCRAEVDECTALREGTTATFSAMKHAADLRSSILKSMTD